MSTPEGEQPKKTLTLNSTLKLNQQVSGKHLEQKFAAKAGGFVEVTVKRRRSPEEEGSAAAAPVQTPPVSAAPTSTHRPASEPAPVRAMVAPTSVPNRQPSAPAAPQQAHASRLSEEDRQARLKMLENAKSALNQGQQRLEQESRWRQDRMQQEAQRQVAEAAAEAAVATQSRSAASDAELNKSKPARVMTKAERLIEEEEETARKSARVEHRKPGASRRNEESAWDSRKLTVTQASMMTDDEQEYRIRSEAAYRRSQQKKKRGEILKEPTAKVVREVTIPETITVQELANRMAERTADVVKVLMKMGVMATATQVIDADTAELVVSECGHKTKRVAEADVEIGLRTTGATTDAIALPRPAVVTIMGHVDHGKTTLLDAIRSTNVAQGEAGGITQHIGAYQVTLPNKQKLTFIDTPGHAAFSSMRARGADVTDVVVLVVAADDGIQEQTIEAINHAKSAKKPIIVAINKMDAPGAEPMRIRTDLLRHELVVEEMGGDILSVEISAKQKTNLDKLLEAIQLQAELLDLKAPVDQRAEGTVIESRFEKGRGTVATILIQKGTLNVGDFFVTGAETGRVRAIMTERGESIKQATPSMPVEVWGAGGAPLAGDDFVVTETEAQARDVAAFRLRKRKEKMIAGAARGSIEQMLSQLAEGQSTQIAVVVKTDAHGSLEAIRGSFEKLGNSEVSVKVMQGGVGEITESDVLLAKTSQALVLAFNVRANANAREMARRDHVDIRYYSIIYDMIDDVKNLLTNQLAPEIRETFVGYAKILQVFKVSGIGMVAGCQVTEGAVRRGNRVRLLRDNVVIHTGKLKTLKRFKDEVKEAQVGQECGMAFENYEDIKVGDQIECFEQQEVRRSLGS